VLLNLPIPEIYVQKATTPTGKTRYAIVDGQQRMRSLLQFVGAETDPDEAENNNFSLDKLDSQSSWRGATFDDLKDAEKVALWGYQFAVRYLNTDDDDDVRRMFVRLNKYLAPLKAQELRNALWQGPFAMLALKLADQTLPGQRTTYWAENGIVSAASIRRMADVEFVSELLIGVMHGPQGGSAKIIDTYYEKFEDEEDEFPGQKDTEKLFAETLQCVQNVFPAIRNVPRWGNKTDFYTLFVAIAGLLRKQKLPSASATKVRKKLITFATEVDERLADEHVKATAEVIKYVRAVEKGANDKPRRGDRHQVVTEAISGFFK
jgi:hypothetical protein